MQDSYSKISIQERCKSHWAVILIAILTPLLLMAVWPILPTHDDWMSTTSPDFRPFFIKEHFLFYGYHWRPFDTWIGYLAGRNPQLFFPALHHTLVVLGHLLCALAVFRLLGVLGFNRTAQNLTTLFFFILPATMATVTAVDSQNQVYALLTDLMAFFVYLKGGKHKYIAWPLLIFLAALCKENGLMWALICPILAFGFNFTDQKTLRKDLLIGIGIMTFYALAIAIQPKDIIIHPEYEPGMLKVVKNMIKFLFTSFITVDYIYLLHQPSRNLLLAIVSLLISLPFFYMVFIRHWRLFLSKKMACTMLCLLIAVGPHLLTVFSMMHTYAGLALVAIMTAYSIDAYGEKAKAATIPFVIFLIAALAIDTHLTHAAIKSGLTGKKMAQEAIQKTGQPVGNVYIVIIEDDYPKLSSFCVIPNEAFGWGAAARYETNYRWPKVLQDTTIVRTPDAITDAKQLSSEIISNRQADCAWIVDHQDVYVVKK